MGIWKPSVLNIAVAVLADSGGDSGVFVLSVKPPTLRNVSVSGERAHQERERERERAKSKPSPKEESETSWSVGGLNTRFHAAFRYTIALYGGSEL